MNRHEAEDEPDILADGQRLRVGLTAMDALQRAVSGFDAGLHRPGFRIAEQAARDASAKAYDEYDARIAAMWKSAPQAAADAEADREAAAAPPEADPREAAYADYDQRVANAWRST